MSSEVYEKIVFKPPIELIPDEYEITEKIAVHTFTSNTVDEQQSAALFIDTLRGDAYKIEENNMHSLANENFKEVLRNSKCCRDYNSDHFHFSNLKNYEYQILAN